MNKDITIFVNEELYPRLFNSLDRAFPQMGFKRYRADWHSPKKIDGSNPGTPRPDKSVITSKIPGRILEQGGESLSLIDLYMNLNGVDFLEAVKQLCSLVGLALPDSDPGQAERWREIERKQIARRESLNRQRKALFADEGKEVLDYLHSRGWSDEEIEKAELGYLSPEEAQRLSKETETYIKPGYPLSIPLSSRGKLYGFKLRTISQEVEGNKYTYTSGTNKKENLFNLPGVKMEDNLIVVEAELDALHAQVKEGISGYYVATGGGSLSEELLSEAAKVGYKRITLLLDNDKPGQGYTRKSIEVARNHEITCFVAVLPDGIKDVDEYLAIHSVEELNSITSDPLAPGKYLANLLRDEYTEKAKDGFTDPLLFDFKNEAFDIINGATTEPEREELLHYIPTLLLGAESIINYETLKAVADERRAEKDRINQRKKTEEALRKATQELQGGDVKAALQTMGEANRELSRIDKRTRFADLLHITTEEERRERMSKRQGDIKTLYSFTHPNGRTEEQLSLPSGAITLVCAPTSHGKSTLLQNLAIQVAQNSETEGDTLYFSFEEDEDSVYIQVLNKFISEELCRQYNQRAVSNNISAISHYYRTGENRYILNEKKQTFEDKKAEFNRELISPGKLRIYNRDFDANELIDAIRVVNSELAKVGRKLKAVFIDYIQLLYIKDYKKSMREELREIAENLRKLAISLQVPIVVAAQLNREVKSPTDLHSQKIAEAADLEREANKVILLWDTAHEVQERKENKKDLEALESKLKKRIQNPPENLLDPNTPGYIYAKITKYRGGVLGQEAIFKFNGNTGVITPNYTPTPDPEPEPQQDNDPWVIEKK